MRTRTEGVGGSGGRSWLVAPAQGPSSSCRQLLGLLSACSWPPGRGTGGAWRGDTSALSWRSERHTTGQHRDGLRTDITGRSRTAVPEQPLCPSGRKTLAGRAQARAHAWVLGSWRSVPGKPHEDAVSRRDGSMEQPLGGVAGGQSGPRAPCEGAWGRGVGGERGARVLPAPGPPPLPGKGREWPVAGEHRLGPWRLPPPQARRGVCFLPGGWSLTAR